MHAGRAVGRLALALLLCAGCEFESSPKLSPGETASGSYVITIYYTAVESFHGGVRIAVRGCPSRDCVFGDKPLGDYPRSFANAVRDEGTGRIGSGVYAGRYLNWSHNVGYWLDTVPANAHGLSLIPFRTAAADPDVLPRGTRFRLEAPLIQDNGAPLEGEAARRLLAATWEIQDEFTPGFGGPLHLDLYIGEEDRVNFTETSPLYIALQGVRLRMQN